MTLINKIPIICITGLLAAFCSCQKVIKIDLNSSSPRYAVEGNITNQPGPYLVTITKSVNFDQDNTAPAVSGAVVVITDNTAGMADTLKETTPGNYQTHTLSGTPGHAYQLYINASNNIFTASCTMPQVVNLDSMYAQQSSFGRNYNIVPVYTDPIAKGNYYYFAETKNDTETAAIFIRNDNLINGGVMKEPLQGGGSGLDDGDRVIIDLQCIDSAVYQYYFTLQQTKNQNSATPANPLSNISGGALGYFSAHTSSIRSIVVP